MWEKETTEILGIETKENVPDVNGAPKVGRVAGTTPSGEILVKFSGYNPTAARLLAPARSTALGKTILGKEVLLVFENGDLSHPIIIGFLDNPLDDIISERTIKEDPDQQKDAYVDGSRITLEAKQEIILKCGKGSITLHKDGKIVIKGTRLLSRSTGSNKIKGARVNIN